MYFVFGKAKNIVFLAFFYRLFRLETCLPHVSQHDKMPRLLCVC